MTLLELCEPLFQYVCRLNRSADKGCTLEIDKVRNEIKRIFEELKQNASADQYLADQYEKVEMPLIFFIDFMIKESKLNFRFDWLELARERNELAGDEKFFDLLDAELADPGNAATERLAIFYTCLGLGFTGVYTGLPEDIRRLMLKISARISNIMDADEKTRICPEAYEGVDTRDFVQLPGTKLVGIGIALVGLIIVWFISCFYLFTWASDEATGAIDTINKCGQSTAVVNSVDDNAD